MKIRRVQPPAPPPVFLLEISDGEGWAVVAALREYAERHPHAVEVEAWRSWAKDLDRKLRE